MKPCQKSSGEQVGVSSLSWLLMGLLWLATFAGTQDRRYRTQHNKRHVLRGYAGIDISSMHIDNAAAHSRVILGLLHVSPGPHYEGPLTPWAEALWRSFRDLDNPADSFAVNVNATFRLDTPILVHEVLDKT